MQIIFMASQGPALQLFRYLSSEHDIVALFTQPSHSPVAHLAQEHNITVYSPKRFTAEDIEHIAGISTTLVLVCNYGLILPPRLLQVHDCINIHFSLLPRWRGASPVTQALLHNDKTTGISLIRMNERIDSGHILFQASLSIRDEHNKTTLTQELCELAGKHISQWLQQYKKGEMIPCPQDNQRSSYAPRLKRTDGYVDLKNETSESLYNKYRAFHTWPGVWFYYQRKRVQIIQMSPLTTTYPPMSQPTQIIARQGHVLLRDSVVHLQKLQMEGKKPLDAVDFFNGQRLNVGDLLV